MNRAQTLENAAAVLLDRCNTHGAPERSFGLIAAYWSAHLGCHVSTADVAAMMALLKLARIASTPAHADHWVDLAGYAACGCELATETNP